MKKLYTFVVLSLALQCGSAHASAFQGYVNGVFAIWGKVFVAVGNGGFSGPGSPCSSASSDSIVYGFDPGTASGKILYANALAAKITGRMVYISGDNSCLPSPYSAAPAEGLAGIDLKG
jgi:hypothetical protein